MKTFTLSLRLLGILCLLFTSQYLSAQEPSYGSATVDGSFAEWNLQDDFFANMYEAGNPQKTLLSKSYLRYDCNTDTIYILVLHENGFTSDQSNDDAWMKVYDLSQSTQVDGDSSTFSWLANNQGWEGSFVLAENNYSEIEIHDNVSGTVNDEFEAGRTTSTGKNANRIPLELDCPDCVKPEPVVTNVAICSDEEYTWSVNGQTYSTAQDITIEGDNCEADQILVLTLTNNPYIEVISKECSEDSPTYSITFESNAIVESSMGQVDNEANVVTGIPSNMEIVLTASIGNCEIFVRVAGETCTDEDPCIEYSGITASLYEVKDHTLESETYKHSVWVNGFPCEGSKSNFSFNDTFKGYAYTLLSNGNFILTGTAVLSGIQNNNCDTNYEGSIWNVYFEFEPIEDVSGVNPFVAHGFSDTGFPSDPIWEYYQLVPGRASMTLAEGDYEYNAITFTKMDNAYAFQVGDGANAKNSGLGAASWLNYTVWTDNEIAYSNSGAIHADININLHEIICEPVFDEDPLCDEFSVFYAHNGPNNASTEIYGVSFGAGMANFTNEPIIDMGEYGNGYRVHIAYDEVANVVYTARNNGSELISFNFNGSEWEELNRLQLDGVPGGIVQNVFHNGRIYLGSSSTNKLYEIDPLTGDVQPWDIDGLSINGGDLAVVNDIFYSANRNGRKIYEIKFINDGTYTGTAFPINENEDTPSQVNGFGASVGGNFLMTNNGKNEIFVLDTINGSQLGSYTVNSPFGTLMDGDLASGCSDSNEDERDPCDNYKAYYANHNGSDTILYEVTLDDNANTASLDEIATFTGFRAHIALNTDNGYIYGVNENTGNIYKVNPNGGTVEGMITLNSTDGSSINSIYAMTYFENRFYLGSANLDQLYQVEMNGDYQLIASGIPVQGGDIVHRDNRLHLATQAGNKLYRILGGDDSEQELGSIPGGVNGLALNASNEFITTHNGESVIYRYDQDGNALTPYSTEGFSFRTGDLTSGCTSADPEPLCEIDPIENPGAEINDFDENTRWRQYGPGELAAGWDTTTSIEIQRSGTVDGNDSYCGDFHFELLSRSVGDNMYQVIDTNPGAMVYVNFWHKKRRINGANPHDEMEVLAGDYGTFDNDGDNLTMLGDVVATSGDEWVFIQRSFEATSDKTVVMLRGLSGTTTSVGNLIDNVYIGCNAEATTECNDSNVPSLDAPQGAYSNSVVDASNVSIYPVPAATNLNIQVDNSGNRVEGTYYITSMNGRASHRGTIQIVNGQSETIQENVASLPEGIYFLVMEINGKTITKRFVKTSR